MAKLYFRYGTMDSAKTLNLLAVAHNYRKQGKSCLLLKPKLDDRFGASKIRSRAGLEAEADLLLEPGTPLPIERLKTEDCILVDEAQFLPEATIEELRDLTIDHGVPVICYGLRTDFLSRLFPGSRRLLELSDSIEEIKVTCYDCGRKAVFNLRLVDGKGVFAGPQVQLGGDEKYVPTCAVHYRQAQRAWDAEQ
ncbi:MAG: thymidine kinase [Polyangiales bacterium]